MEEPLQIHIHGQTIILTPPQLQTLSPIITQEQLIQIPWPFSAFQPQLSVVNSCMHFILVIERGWEQKVGVDFRQRVLSSISTHYLKSGMDFQLYQYAYICSHFLHLPLQNCVHIIYYLVYCRFASKPYVAHLIKEQQQMARSHAKTKTEKIKRDHIRSCNKINDSKNSYHCKTLNICSTVPDDQTTKFYKELRKVLTPQIQLKKMGKKLDKKYNFKKQYQGHQKNEEEQQAGLCFSANSSRIVKIPVKVAAYENSSTFKSIKISMPGHQKSLSFKKINMRRQKFREEFNGAERYISLFQQNQRDSIDSNTWKYLCDGELRNQKSKIQKKPFEYFKDISNKVKSKNEEFDRIRRQSMPRSKVQNKNRQESEFNKTYRNNTAGGLFYRKIANENRDRGIRSEEVSPKKDGETSEVGVLGEVKIQRGLLSCNAKKVSMVDNKKWCLGNITRQKQRKEQEECFSFMKQNLTTQAKLQKYKLDFKQFLNRQIEGRVYRIQ